MRPLLPEVQAFQDQVQQLAGAPSDPSHPEAVQALRSLAAALRATPGEQERVTLAAIVIEQQATLIERSGPHSLSHADATKKALAEAIVAIEALKQAQGRAAGGPADPLEMARRDLEGINPGQPFLRQREGIVQAFQHVAAALAEVGRY